MVTLMRFVGMFDNKTLNSDVPELMKTLRSSLGSAAENHGKEYAGRLIDLLFSEGSPLHGNWSWLKLFCVQYVKQYKPKHE